MVNFPPNSANTLTNSIGYWTIGSPSVGNGEVSPTIPTSQSDVFLTKEVIWSGNNRVSFVEAIVSFTTVKLHNVILTAFVTALFFISLINITKSAITSFVTATFNPFFTVTKTFTAHVTAIALIIKQAMKILTGFVTAIASKDTPNIFKNILAFVTATVPSVIKNITKTFTSFVSLIASQAGQHIGAATGSFTYLIEVFANRYASAQATATEATPSIFKNIQAFVTAVFNPFFTLTKTFTAFVKALSLPFKQATKTFTGFVTIIALRGSSVIGKNVLAFVTVTVPSVIKNITKTFTSFVTATFNPFFTVAKTFTAHVTAIALLIKQAMKILTGFVTAIALRSSVIGKNILGIVNALLLLGQRSIIKSAYIAFVTAIAKVTENLIPGGKVFTFVVTAVAETPQKTVNIFRTFFVQAITSVTKFTTLVPVSDITIAILTKVNASLTAFMNFIFYISANGALIKNAFTTKLLSVVATVSNTFEVFKNILTKVTITAVATTPLITKTLVEIVKTTNSLVKNVIKQAYIAFVTATFPVITAVPIIIRAFTFIVTAVALSPIHLVLKNIQTFVTANVAMTRSILGTTFTFFVTVSNTLIKNVTKQAFLAFVTVSVGFSRGILHLLSKVFNGSLTSAIQKTPLINRLQFVTTKVPTLFFAISKALVMFGSITVSMTRNLFRTLIIPVQALGFVNKLISKTYKAFVNCLNFTTAQVIKISRFVNLTFSIIAASSFSTFVINVLEDLGIFKAAKALTSLSSYFKFFDYGGIVNDDPNSDADARNNDGLSSQNRIIDDDF